MDGVCEGSGIGKGVVIVEGATGSHGFLGWSGADDEDDEADNEWRMWLKIWKAAMVGAEGMVEKSDLWSHESYMSRKSVQLVRHMILSEAESGSCTTDWMEEDGAVQASGWVVW